MYGNKRSTEPRNLNGGKWLSSRNGITAFDTEGDCILLGNCTGGPRYLASWNKKNATLNGGISGQKLHNCGLTSIV